MADNRKAHEFPIQIHLVGSTLGAMFGFDDATAAKVKCDDMNSRAADAKLTARYEVRS